jgi:hypothetical protein
MKKTILLLMAILLMCFTVDARPKHFYKDWKWWTGEAMILTAVTLDAQSTCHGFSHGYVETNFLARGSISCGHAISALAIGGGIYTTLHLLNRKYIADGESKTWDFLGYTEVPAIAGAFHLHAAAHNYSLP